MDREYTAHQLNAQIDHDSPFSAAMDGRGDGDDGEDAMTDDDVPPCAKSQSIASSVDEDEPPAESVDDTPDCVSGSSHHWVSGEANQLDGGGVEIVSRQCRVCGYTEEMPEGERMRILPTEENES